MFSRFKSGLCGLLQVAFSCVESSINFTERAFQDGSQVEVLNIKKQINDRLSNLSTSIWKLDPCTGTLLYFIPQESLLNQVKKVGCVVDCLANAARSTVRLGKAEEGVMYNLLCGQTRMFHIQTRNENGDCCSASVDDIKIEIVEPNNVRRCLACFESEPKGSGSFCFTYRPMEIGTYSMSVKVQDIKGNPFTWNANCWHLEDIPQQNIFFPFFAQHQTFVRRSFTVTNAGLDKGCFSWKMKGSSAFSVGIIETTSNNYATQGDVYEQGFNKYHFISEGNEFRHPREWLWSNDDRIRRKNISDNSSNADTGDLFNIYLNLYKNRLLIEHIGTSELYEVDLCGVNCPVSPLFRLDSPESSVLLVES